MKLKFIVMKINSREANKLANFETGKKVYLLSIEKCSQQRFQSTENISDSLGSKLGKKVENLPGIK